jgi:hypothetical protein
MEISSSSEEERAQPTCCPSCCSDSAGRGLTAHQSHDSGLIDQAMAMSTRASFSAIENPSTARSGMDLRISICKIHHPVWLRTPTDEDAVYQGARFHAGL